MVQKTEIMEKKGKKGEKNFNTIFNFIFSFNCFQFMEPLVKFIGQKHFTFQITAYNCSTWCHHNDGDGGDGNIYGLLQEGAHEMFMIETLLINKFIIIALCNVFPSFTHSLP